MSDITSDAYKQGFITGMAMNPLMVTKETAPAPATPQSASSVIVANGASGILGVTVIRNIVTCTDGTEGGV